VRKARCYSHDAAAVLALCERAIWLEAGSVRAIGDARDVCHQYQASIEGEKDNANAFRISGSRKAPSVEQEFPTDHRESTFKDLGLVPKVSVSAFDPDAPSFGKRGASIEKVSIVDASGRSLTSFEGGEEVTLVVDCIAHEAIAKPIVGFLVKDRLGQDIFGDNTYLTFRDQKREVPARHRFSARFVFRLPFLKVGDYSVTIGLAEGTQEDHVQHHWADDTLFFKVTVHSVKGMVGIPMKSVLLVVDAEPAPC
jgi:lipopolysaccharide transport system ATP-binding protein